MPDAGGAAAGDIVGMDDDTDCYVESMLNTQVTYMKLIEETYQGEKESSKWPVTPYTVKVQNDTADNMWCAVYVDGHQANNTAFCEFGSIVKPGEEKVIDGFEETTGVKEFLFSLPRFARDEKDKLKKERYSDIGTIKVTCWKAEFQGHEMRTAQSKSSFNSANKKDAHKVTKGNYLMSTTQAGKSIRSNPYGKMPRQTTVWTHGDVLADFKIKYRMDRTLEQMGIEVQKQPKGTKF